MEIDNDVKKDEVESLVRELMVGGKGKEMKKKVMEWKRLAQEATESSSGSSFLNLDKRSYGTKKFEVMKTITVSF
ncbi:unnamed protein product [Camellia sinensis]